jgi:hypothetical protein
MWEWNMIIQTVVAEPEKISGGAEPPQTLILKLKNSKIFHFNDRSFQCWGGLSPPLATPWLRHYQTMKQISLSTFKNETVFRRRKNNYYKSSFHKNHTHYTFCGYLFNFNNVQT